LWEHDDLARWSCRPEGLVAPVIDAGRPPVLSTPCPPSTAVRSAAATGTVSHLRRRRANGTTGRPCTRSARSRCRAASSARTTNWSGLLDTILDPPPRLVVAVPAHRRLHQLPQRLRGLLQVAAHRVGHRGRHLRQATDLLHLRAQRGHRSRIGSGLAWHHGLPPLTRRRPIHPGTRPASTPLTRAPPDRTLDRTPDRHRVDLRRDDCRAGRLGAVPFEFVMGVLAGVGLSLIGSWLLDRARVCRHVTTLRRGRG